jgi:hypothetical protein
VLFFLKKKNKNKIKTIIPTTPDRIKMSCSLFIYFLLTKRTPDLFLIQEDTIELLNLEIVLLLMFLIQGLKVLV